MSSEAAEAILRLIEMCRFREHVQVTDMDVEGLHMAHDEILTAKRASLVWGVEQAKQCVAL